MKGDDEAQSPSPGKVPRRKYKRHPKPDPNAPERPLTAYVRFSKDKRREYQDRRLSFSELAKQIGLDWQDLSPTLKSKYLGDAASDWTEFRKALDDYHATEKYAEYIQYLRDFASENPESNVKLPHLDFATPSVQGSSNIWEAEASPISDGMQSTALLSEPHSATQVRNEADLEQLFQSYGQQQLPQLQHYNEVPNYGHMDGVGMENTEGLSNLPTSQDFSVHLNQDLPNFSNPWQTQPYMSLNAIGPGSRYSRGNLQLNQALSRASDAHASGAGEHSSGSTSNLNPSTQTASASRTTMPNSDLGARTGVNDGFFQTSVQTYGHYDHPLEGGGELQGLQHIQQQQLHHPHLPSQHIDENDALNSHSLMDFDVDILSETFEDFVAPDHDNLQ